MADAGTITWQLRVGFKNMEPIRNSHLEDAGWASV
jgi:hypothetical protein